MDIGIVYYYNELSAVGLLDVSQSSKQPILHHAHKIYHLRANHYIGHFAHFKRVLKDFLSLESKKIETSDMICTTV